MSSSSEKFLDIVHSFIVNQQAKLEETSVEEWEEIYGRAVEQKLEMAVYEVVYSTGAFQSVPRNVKEEWKSEVKRGAFMELRKTERFFEIYKTLLQEDIRPFVLKGVVCRFLYAKPYLRSSSDEDLFITGRDFTKCCRVLERLQLERSESVEGNVCSFTDTKSTLRLEVHRELFDEAVSINRELNQWFHGVWQSEYFIEIEGNRIRTMEPEMHLLYLFAHWIKHFIGPGIGVRQLCDISLFINQYGSQMDWHLLWKKLEASGYDRLCANLLELGMCYFSLKRECVDLPDGVFQNVDPAYLLDDMLQAGIYGSSSVSRLHSSSLTLDAVEGKKGKMHILFPPAKNLYGRYKILRYCPWMLPFVWVHRTAHYVWEVFKNKQGDNSPVESIAIGNSRIDLLKKYQVLK